MSETGSVAGLGSVTADAYVGYTPLNRDLTYELNRCAGTLDALGNPTLAGTGAANIWAATTGLALLGALNVENGTTDLGLRAVCNSLGSTDNVDPAEALREVASPS